MKYVPPPPKPIPTPEEFEAGIEAAKKAATAALNGMNMLETRRIDIIREELQHYKRTLMLLRRGEVDQAHYDLGRYRDQQLMFMQTLEDSISRVSRLVPRA